MEFPRIKLGFRALRPMAQALPGTPMGREMVCSDSPPEARVSGATRATGPARRSMGWRPQIVRCTGPLTPAQVFLEARPPTWELTFRPLPLQSTPPGLLTQTAAVTMVFL